LMILFSFSIKKIIIRCYCALSFPTNLLYTH
jgi:hypothetical protein